jgi:putative membrane protein
MLSSRIGPLTVALIMLDAGCTSRGSEAAERSDSVGRRDSVAGVAAASMNDNNVIALLEQTHAADSALGSLGATNGTSADVKEFGRMILREHHALRKDAIDLAEELGLTPQASRVPPDDAPAAMRQALAAAKTNAAWDRAYIDYAIALHQAAMENTARALAATHRAEIKQFIGKSVPILQKHLDKAKSLRKSLPKDVAAPPASRPAPASKR